MNITKTTAHFDLIDVEYFERRFCEILKTLHVKQEEINEYENKIQDLRASNSRKYLTIEGLKIQWQPILRQCAAVREYNLKFRIDTERTEIIDKINKIKTCKLPSTLEHNKLLTQRNTQLELNKHYLAIDLEQLNEALTATELEDGQFEMKIILVEQYRGRLVNELGLLKKQMQVLCTVLNKTSHQHNINHNTLQKIKKHTEHMKIVRKELNLKLSFLQITSSIHQLINTTNKQDNKHEATIKTDIRNELKQSLDNETKTNIQLKQCLVELKQIGHDTISNHVCTNEDTGELMYRDEIVIPSDKNVTVMNSNDKNSMGDMVEAQKYFDTQDDAFVLENYLTFDDD